MAENKMLNEDELDKVVGGVELSGFFSFKYCLDCKHEYSTNVTVCENCGSTNLVVRHRCIGEC